MKNGLYIYGIIKNSPPASGAGDPQEFGEIGVGDGSSKVQTIGFRDLAAVVSPNPLRVYDSLAKEKTVKDLVTHQFVIEKVMESFTIIPVKFGTMVKTKDEVTKFLDKGYFLLRNALRKIEGKIELDVVASWNLPKTLATIYRRSRRIKRKQEEIFLKGKEATVEEKVTLGRLVEKALKTRKTRLNRLVLPALKREAVDVCLHDLATDEIVFNAAFLLKKENEEFFNRAVNRLNQKLVNTLDFRVVGPLPPYSFSTILFERINPCEAEEAKKRLGLNGEITDKAVRNAYRQLAQEFHPDKNAGVDPLQFNLINSAYKLLKDFVEKGYFHVDIYRWEGRP